jgi:hypothetical protein
MATVHPHVLAPTLADLFADITVEVARQDRVHPSGYPATRDGVRLGIATGVDELDEALDAWRIDRCRCETPLCGHAYWQVTRAEMLQAAAVIVRTIRSIDQHRVALDAAEAAEEAGR